MLSNFSYNVTEELPAEAAITANFISKIDKLFDCLNADSADRKRGKPYSTNFTSRSPHMSVFAEMKELFTNMKFIGSRRTPPSQLGWVKLLNGYERLWDNLSKKYNVSSIATRRINQDPLENAFGSIRSNCGSNDNPTVAQFIGGLKTALISNLRNINNGNCEADTASLVENFQKLLTETKFESSQKLLPAYIYPDQVDALEQDSNFEEISADSQAAAYVAGFIYKRISRECFNCKKAMLATKPTVMHIFTQFKEYVDGKHSLQYINVNFAACVEKSADIINEYLKTRSHIENVRKNVLDVIGKNVSFCFLKVCEEHYDQNVEKIKYLLTTILLHRFCTLENRKFSNEASDRMLRKKIKILKHS